MTLRAPTLLGDRYSCAAVSNSRFSLEASSRKFMCCYHCRIVTVDDSLTFCCVTSDQGLPRKEHYRHTLTLCMVATGSKRVEIQQIYLSLDKKDIYPFSKPTSDFAPPLTGSYYHHHGVALDEPCSIWGST
jgi:hypothetical protein